MKGLLALILIVYTTISYSNNVRIVGSAHLVSKNTSAGANNSSNYQYIQFNIAWDNAWRTDLGGTGNSAPNNYDAAWVFAKYRIGGGEWKHISINQFGNISEPNTTLLGVADSKGVFLYNSANFTGNFTSNNNQLKWFYVNDGVNDNDNIEVKIFAIEMVHIPQGNYFLGTPGDEIGSFKQGTSTAPYEITSESAITIGSSSLYYKSNQTNGWPDGNSGDRQGTIPTSFPKGFNGFYLMKYEVTQEQYVDFLNSLNRTQQNTHTGIDISGTSPQYGRSFVMSKSLSPSFRNGIRCNNTLPTGGSINFYCDLNNNGVPNESDDGQTIACNYLSWSDDAAYADWSGLRPMTEMEYEKAARGAGQTGTAWEEAGGIDVWNWGSMAEEIIVNPGTVNEVADRSSDKVNYWASRRTGKVQIGGPMRVGCFADATSSRIDATAGYYGNMNLSDNVYERVISVGTPEGRAFLATHGDGNLSANGEHTNTDWPNQNAMGSGMKGADWCSGIHHTSAISHRYNVITNSVIRSGNAGFRACRTQP